MVIGKRRIIFGLQMRTKPEKEKKEYMFCGGDKNGERHRGKYLEKVNIFLRRRRQTEKEKEANMWRKKTFFLQMEKKNGEGKGGKYLEKENIVCGGEENKRRKRR